MTIDRAREILGNRVEKMSDDEVQSFIEMIGTVCTIVIEEKITNR